MFFAYKWGGQKRTKDSIFGLYNTRLEFPSLRSQKEASQKRAKVPVLDYKGVPKVRTHPLRPRMGTGV